MQQHSFLKREELAQFEIGLSTILGEVGVVRARGALNNPGVRLCKVMPLAEYGLLKREIVCTSAVKPSTLSDIREVRYQYADWNFIIGSIRTHTHTGGRKGLQNSLVEGSFQVDDETGNSSRYNIVMGTGDLTTLHLIEGNLSPDQVHPYWALFKAEFLPHLIRVDRSIVDALNQFS